MQITDIDAKIDTAIFYLEKTIDEVERAANNYEIFPCEVTLAAVAPNYIKSAFQLAELRQQLMMI